MSVVTSSFYCIKCAHKVPLPRRRGQQREKGHLKRIYCIRCAREINHLEVREFDTDFNLEKFKQDIADGVYAEYEEEIKSGK